MSHRLRVAAVQMTSGTDSEANLEQAVALVRHAAGLEARYVQLPEYASFWGPASYYPQAAQTLDGEFVTVLVEGAHGPGTAPSVLNPNGAAFGEIGLGFGDGPIGGRAGQ